MRWGGWHRWRKMNRRWELSQHPAGEALFSSKRVAKGFFSSLEVRWLFKCWDKDDTKHMFYFPLADVWDFAPPAYNWFLICFHTSLAVPKSRNKRAEEQQKCEDQEQHSPPTDLTFGFLVIFLCWAGLHMMSGFLDLIPCSYLVTVYFGLLLLHNVSAISWNFLVSMSEVFLPVLPDIPYISNGIYSQKDIFLDQTPSRFQSFGTTYLPGFRPSFGYNWPTKEVSSSLANSCEIREVFKPLLQYTLIKNYLLNGRQDAV